MSKLSPIAWGVIVLVIALGLAVTSLVVNSSDECVPDVINECTGSAAT